MGKITVINIHSLSYTGTTWVNLVLGCREDAMALGPLDRIWRVLKGDLKNAPSILGHDKNALCVVHGNSCDFWPSFADKYSVNDNLFLALHERTGKSIFSTNNISDVSLRRMMENPLIEAKNIYLVRDGRDLVASFLRKHKHKRYIQGITEFLQPSFSNFPFGSNNDNQMSLRYEDLMGDLPSHLRLFSAFIGVDYHNGALQFWNRRHHLAHGNPGTVATLRLAEGLDIADFEGAEFYREQFERLKEFGPQSFVDRRGAEVASRMDLFIFDCLAGVDNARFGYVRDEFTASERHEFGKSLPGIIAANDISEYHAAQLRPHFSGARASMSRYLAELKRPLRDAVHKLYRSTWTRV